MMISPETYRELHLKGKTIEEIEKEIRSLKRTISKQKKILDNPYDYQEEMMIHPDPQVVLFCSRDYLIEAKKALIEAGGEYKPTKREVEQEWFIDNICNIKRLSFKEGDYLYMCDLTAEPVVFTRINEKTGKEDVATDDYYDTKEEVLDFLESLHIEEWKKVYKAEEDPKIPNDMPWELHIERLNTEDAGAYEIISYKGINRRPYDLVELEDFFGV